MTRTQSRIKLSLLLGTIIALGVLSLAVNNIPVQALHKEEQKLDKFDNLKEFADAVKKGDAKIEKIPLLSMKASSIYDDADKQTQDCINLAAKIGKTLVANEVVHCVDDVNFFNSKISNSSVPTTTTSSAIIGTSADTGTGGTSTSDTSTPTSDTSTSSSGDVKENNMINELVKTGKFTEAEAKDFVSKTTQNGADGGSTSDSPKTSNADTITSDTQPSDNTQSSNNQDNNANTQSSSSQDNNANTQSSSSQDNNNQSSNANSNKAIEYNDLKDLVHSIKNHVVDSDDITLNAFQDSGAYKGADEASQKCIDLAGKIGGKLGDQEIVHCSEDPNFYQNQISSNNNNANDNNNANSKNDNNNDNNANSNNDNNANSNPDGTGN